VLGLFFYYNNTPYLWTVLAFFAIVYAIVAYPYWNLWRRIKAIPTHSLKESLTKYLAVVRLFIRRVEWFCLLGMPIGALFGMCMAHYESGGAFTLSFVGFMGLVGLVIGLLSYVPIKYWYIPKMYGRTEKELQELLQELEEA
jgi:hypothetical protein